MYLLLHFRGHPFIMSSCGEQGVVEGTEHGDNLI